MEKHMRFVIGGGLLLIFGIVLFVLGYSMIESIQQYDVEGIPISEFLKQVSEDVRDNYLYGQLAEVFGGIFGGIGFVLMISGILIPLKKSNDQFLKIKDTNNIPIFTVQDKAINILKKRYAKGEITKEKYEQMKKDLEEK